jgi:putative restriction endonuclease
VPRSVTRARVFHRRDAEAQRTTKSPKKETHFRSPLDADIRHSSFAISQIRNSRNALQSGLGLCEKWRVAVGNQNWEDWLGRLYSLRRDKRGDHERPHKPVLLLSILDLLDRRVIRENAVPFSDDLVATFKRYFAVVKRHDDKPTIENPFYFLAGDKFWQVTPQGAKEPLYREGYASGAPGVAQLRRQSAIGRFDPGLWALMADPLARHQLREALIARYFPEDRDKLAALVMGTRLTRPAETFSPLEAEKALREELPPGRDAAFRRTILEVYDYRCAACGIRVLLDHVVSLVEAAHLIPFGESRNDKPTNGMALCPNHHWAMDRHLIAPCPDTKRRAGIWRVNGERLDDRIEGQRDLVALAGKAVIPPSEEKFYPGLESLRWREEHLATAYR